MRILSLEEVLALPLDTPRVMLPDEYGAIFHGWFRYRPERHECGTELVEHWAAVVQRLPLTRRIFPMSGRYEAICLAMPTAALRFEGSAAFQARRLPGCLYLEVLKFRLPGWRDEEEQRHLERQVVQFEKLLGGRNLPEFGDSDRWVIETWFEPPPGFVWETARLLSRELGERHTFTETFARLVYDEVPEAKRRWEERLALLDEASVKAGRGVLVRPPLVGPDLTWRFSENPWWVQSILLARLMGGSRWSYVWGALEALQGKVTDWTLLHSSPRRESPPVKQESHHDGNDDGSHARERVERDD